jgi:hypothetical protein
MPILGTIASSTRQGLSTTSYDSIASVVDTSGGSGVITFNSIPSTYQHLEIRLLGKSANTTYDSIYVTARFNNDSSSVYNCQRIYGNPAALNVLAMYNGSYTDQFICGILVASGGGTNSANNSPCIIRVMDYTNTSKFKTVNSYAGYNRNSTSNATVDVSTGLWRSTSAISRIDLYGDFKNYTVAGLYGIKG